MLFLISTLRISYLSIDSVPNFPIVLVSRNYSILRISWQSEKRYCNKFYNNNWIFKHLIVLGKQK